MATKKSAAKPTKAPAKSAAKAAPKSAAKPVPKPSKAVAKPAASAPAPAKPASKAVAAKPFGRASKDADEPPVKMPSEKLSGNTMALIEVVKEGHFFIARTETHAGTKEYKNTVFEDLLTEMLITLQEQLSD